MYEVVNIGQYDNNHKLYEVTNDTRRGTSRYTEKSTYIVSNRDADKFERIYQKQNKLFDNFKKYDNPEFQKKASLKLKIGAVLGGIIGGGVPLSIFAFTKNKYARVASVLASLIGAVVGVFYGVAFTTIHSVIPKKFKEEYSKNQAEFLKLNIIKIKEEKQKIAEIDYRK